MRFQTFYLFFLALLITSSAIGLTPSFTMDEVIAKSPLIAKLRILSVRLPKTDDIMEPVVCAASVEEVIKGREIIKQIEFRFHAYGDLSLENVPKIVGKGYLLFLHIEHGQYWLFTPGGFTPLEESRHLEADVRRAIEAVSKKQ